MTASRNTTEIAMAGQKIASCLFLLGLLAALSACAAGSTATPLGPAPAAEPATPASQRLTARQISEQCWMKNEATKGDIDQRMKIVNKCIDDKTKEQQGR
jgi:hypothetical protein